jgi:hypothetical protein
MFRFEKDGIPRVVTTSLETLSPVLPIDLSIDMLSTKGCRNGQERGKNSPCMLVIRVGDRR